MIAAIAAALTLATGPAPQALPDCLGKPQVRPAAIVLACADANFGVRKLRWTGWGAPFAAATGIAYANDCTPNCAAGHMHAYRAVLVVSGTQRCPDGKAAYSRVTVAFVGPSPYPKAKAADLVYPARCR
ncbi:MAG TPA: hypothetical protein VGN27_02225 [Gaiellaceae bacterium]|nr:hypothetical protein [Gaiellaceae bacterium]